MAKDEDYTTGALNIPDCEGHEEADRNAEPTNEEHACKAWVTLCQDGEHHDAYASCGEVDTAIVDMLADLRHLCDLEELDFSAIDSRAYAHYAEEKGGRNGQG